MSIMSTIVVKDRFSNNKYKRGTCTMNTMLMSRSSMVLNWTLLVVFALMGVVGQVDSAQPVLNTPPIMLVDRNWRISETEPVGSVITRVRADDAEKDELTFDLEPKSYNNLYYGDSSNTNSSEKSLPFRIDPKTGVVRLNESLIGRGGESFFLYVTVSDGKVTAKNEVLVSILNQNATQKSPSLFTPVLSDIKKILPSNIFPPNGNNNRNILPPPALPQFPQNNNFHDYGIVGQPEISGGGGVYSSSTPQTKTYPDRPYGGGLNDRIDRINATTLRRQPPANRNRSAHDSLIYETIAAINATAAVDSSTFSVNKPMNDAAESRDIPVIPVILVICLIFLIAGIVALVIFRKNLCAIGKTLKKKSKLDQAKKSNQSNGSNATEDSRNSIVMNHWNGPTAFGNRYTSPWERDSAHQQVTSQLSNGSTPSQGSTNKDRWEFPRHRLKVFNILGEGAFGQVWRCEATDIDGVEGVSEVAVKTLKENAAEAERKDLLSELDVMKSLEPHINVVRLLGCCTEKDPIFVIIEYVNHGKLQSYLRNSRVEKHYGNTHGKSKTLTSGDLTSFMYQVARGMDFLTSRGIIHRDLAARNILITDDRTCKVADFGFARDIVTSKVYERKSEGRLPIRWMAIESLYDNIFTIKSDIWSFGILMWEIVTLGSTPYPGIAAADVMKKVRDGYRLEKPEHCRRELYNIMYYCWAKDPKDRPTFSECVELLDKLLVTETDYIELERFPDHNYYNMLNISGEKL